MHSLLLERRGGAKSEVCSKEINTELKKEGGREGGGGGGETRLNFFARSPPVSMTTLWEYIARTKERGGGGMHVIQNLLHLGLVV